MVRDSGAVDEAALTAAGIAGHGRRRRRHVCTCIAGLNADQYAGEMRGQLAATPEPRLSDDVGPTTGRGPGVGDARSRRASSGAAPSPPTSAKARSTSDGKGWSIQDVMPQRHRRRRAPGPTPDNLKLVGIDFYHRYADDIALFAEMGFTVFRTSDRLVAASSRTATTRLPTRRAWPSTTAVLRRARPARHRTAGDALPLRDPAGAGGEVQRLGQPGADRVLRALLPRAVRALRRPG